MRSVLNNLVTFPTRAYFIDFEFAVISLGPLYLGSRQASVSILLKALETLLTQPALYMNAVSVSASSNCCCCFFFLYLPNPIKKER